MSRKILFILFALAAFASAGVRASKIDRRALVGRHKVEIRDRNLRGVAQVGNGRFAFGFDISGLQTFSPQANTLSDWGWYRFPLPCGQQPEDFRGEEWDTHGRPVRYDIPNAEQGELRGWMVRNPQRFNLGRIGLALIGADGRPVGIDRLENPVQQLDLWTGVARSVYAVDGERVEVTTVAHPDLDAVGVHIKSSLVARARAGLTVRFPFPDNREFGNAADWNSPGRHTTTCRRSASRASFHRVLDESVYDVHIAWSGRIEFIQEDRHRYRLMPASGSDEVSFVIVFDKITDNAALPDFARTLAASRRHWADFWLSGGAIDLSGSRDSRWFELERRIVLSQYLMAVNEAGLLPPQESGLFNNGWYGKYHFEMIWWHAAHYALWGRWPMAAELMKVYARNLGPSRARAARQGYAGARWPKTLGDHAWWEWPLDICALLIWQQPHPIFFAELAYRQAPCQATIDEWREVVFASADFMASYAHHDSVADRYVLGYPLQVVGENADPRTTVNPAFELSYWRTGLRLAQQWRARCGLPPSARYAAVLEKLSPLPRQEGVYVSWENISDMWTRYCWEHPALIGAYGMLPGDGVDPKTMARTLDKVNETWNFGETWGWDFPMLAMTAARLGKPELALRYLLDYPSFHFDAFGLVGGGRAPFPYFPGNGGLLYAAAMMAAGWDGAPAGAAPGFPRKGWKVKSEGLYKAL